jgi:DNA polymerase elongation subunit (family B)
MPKYVVSAGYDKDQNSVYLKVYDEATEKLEEWYDDSYKAYCLSDNIESFHNIPITNITQITKYDALHDTTVDLFKGYFSNPLDVKRTHLDDEEFDETAPKFWENHIRFYMGYIYDNNVKMGMPYDSIGNPYIDKDAESRTATLLDLFSEKSITKELIRLFEYPAPNYRRASLDIEVLNEQKKIPRPEIANLPVLCACIKTLDGKRIAFLLLQPNKQFEKYPNVDELYVFSDEKEMLLALFKYIQQFPLLITFNGDGFDLMYLRNRAYRFGIQNEFIPFSMSGISMYMRSTLHIDLYRFFQINAIRNYAFQGKYKDVSLDVLSNLFLKIGKLKGEHQWVGDMDYYDLINYCMRDAELTLGLTTFDDNLVMNLMTAISRISRMPIEECSRKAVGRWIASFLFCQHRQLNYLIPRPQDILEMKGHVATKSMIKGKQYEGAMVIKPKSGVPFNVQDIDYGSLYPSVIKFYNVGYATIRCKHGESWQKLSNQTKRFIWLLCYLSTKQRDDNQCPIEKRMNLMRNIEKEIENTIENIEKITQKDAIKSPENVIENLWKTLIKEKQEVQTGGQKLNQIQYCINEPKNINDGGLIKNEKNYENNLLNLKVANVNDVEILMNELLRYITLTEEMSSKEEIFTSLLEKWIGQNYNSFALIAIELLDMSECGSNKFGNLPHWICTKHKALESIFIGSLRDLRLSWYKKESKNKVLTDAQKSWYKCIEQTIKVFMNASYGVFATEGGFAFGCPPVSEEIAGISRSIIQATAQHAIEMGIIVLYGDTDSLFIRKSDKVPELQKWAFEQYKIDLELDKEYRFMCFSSRKKNYIGVQPNGEVDIKGMTGKKSHTPEYFKKSFNEIKAVLKNVQKEDEIPEAKIKISKIALQSYKNLKERKWNDIDDLAFHMTVNKRLSDYGKKTSRTRKDGTPIYAAIPQHIKAVRLLEKEGYAMEAGSIISFVKTKNKEKVLPLELAKNQDIDVDKYTSFLESMLNQVLEPLELEFDEILGHIKLDRFCVNQ